MEEGTIFQPNVAQPQKEATPTATPHASPQPIPQTSGIPKPMWQQAPPPPKINAFLSLAIKIVGGIIVLLLIVFIIFSFVLPMFAPKTTEQITLNYWGIWEDENTMKAIFADFEKQNPNVKVTYTRQDKKDYRSRLATRIQNNTGPDVFLFHDSWVPQVSSILLPLPDDVMSKSEFEKSFYPVIVTDLTHNGGIYGVPFGFDTLAMFINTEIFQKAGETPPTNWADFGRVARALTVKDESGKILTSGAALGTFDNITHAPDILSLLFAQNGADFHDSTNTSNAMIDTLDFYTQFAKDEGSVWDQTLDPSVLAFAKGNLAMYFGYSWDIFTIRAVNPNISFEVVSVPHLPGRNMTVASYWASGVSIKSLHRKEALALLKFLAQKETMQKLFSEESKTRLFGEPYPRSDLASLLKDNALIYPFVNQGMDAASSFFASDTYDDGFNAQLNGYLGNAVRGMLSGISSESAVETLTKGISQVLSQYGQ